MSRRKHRKARRPIVLFGTLHLPRKVLYRGLIIVAALMVLVLAGFFASRTNLADQVEIEEPELEARADEAQRVLVDDEGVPTPLTQLLNKHYAALPRADVESISFSGQYLAQKSEFSLELYGIRSGRFRQTLKFGDNEFEVGYNGAEYWEVANGILQNRELVGLERLNQEILKLEAAYYAIVWSFNDSKLRNLTLKEGNEVFGGKLCQVLVNDGFLMVPVSHYIEESSGLELGREATLNLESEHHLVRIRYKYGDELLDASTGTDQAKKRLIGYVLEVDDKEFAEARIESVRFNLGMPPWFFDPSPTERDPLGNSDEFLERRLIENLNP